NTALRFRPTAELFAALNQPVPPEAQFTSGGSRSGRGGQGRNADATRPGNATGGGASAPNAGSRGGAPAAALPGGRDLAAGSPAKSSGADPQAGEQGGGGGRGFDPARMMER